MLFRSFKVSFTSGCWRYKTFNAQSKSDKQNDPFPLDLYPLLYGANDFSRLIEFDLDNGGKLVLNGMDFFRAAYGHSPELKRILTSYPYQIKPPGKEDSILSLLLPPFPSHLKPSGNLDVAAFPQVCEARCGIFGSLEARCVYETSGS